MLLFTFQRSAFQITLVHKDWTTVLLYTRESNLKNLEEFLVDNKVAIETMLVRVPV